MAMLHIMANVKKRFSTELIIEIVNFNHKLRAEADEEKVFVEKWANNYNFKFHYRERKDEPTTNGSIKFDLSVRVCGWYEMCELLFSMVGESSLFKLSGCFYLTRLIACLSVCIYLPIHLPIYLFIYLYIYLSDCLLDQFQLTHSLINSLIHSFIRQCAITLLQCRYQQMQDLGAAKNRCH